MKAILPPERVIQGGDLSYLKDMKDTTSYKVISRDDRGVMVHIDEADVMGLIKIKNLTQGSSIAFWGLIDDLIENGNNISPHAGIWDLEIFLEADIAILDETVPEGLHGAEPGMLWKDWKAGGDQSLATSLDGTKVILRTNINNTVITKEEITILKQYIADNPLLNIVRLNVPEYKELVSSTAYLSEE